MPAMNIFFKLQRCLIKQPLISGNLGMLFFIVGFSTPTFSQITIVENNNASQLVQSIMGKGYNVSNAKLTCPTGAIGTFVNVTSNIGISQGILLTTGKVSNAKGPNIDPGITVKNGGSGDAQLQALAGTITKDACVLEFDLEPTCDKLNINYVFASEEYPLFVGSAFNDIFAFFISGPGITGTQNIAIVPNSTVPVAINNVNATTNNQYFVDNADGKTIEYNGFTKPLTASISIIPCKVYHLKLAITDVSDDNLDSGVFIESGSISCPAPEIISPPICANTPSVSLCAPAGYTYDWPAGQPGAIPPLNQQCLTVNNPKAGDVYTVNLTNTGGGCAFISKTTLKGLDFTVRDTSVCAGAPKFALNVNPLTKGNYTFKWEPATNLSCTNCQSPIVDPQSTQTYTVTVSDSNLVNCNRVKQVKVTVGAGFTISSKNEEICEGENVTLTVKGADSYIWQPGNLSGATQTVSPSITTTYTITGTSSSTPCPGNAITTATVTVHKKKVVTADDLIICQGETAKLNGSIIGGNGKGRWSGGAGQFIPNRTTINASYIPTQTEQNTGIVILTLESDDSIGTCPKASKQIQLTIKSRATVDAGVDQIVCSGSPVHLQAVVSLGASGIWSGGTGTYTPTNTNPNALYIPSSVEKSAGEVKLKFTVTNNSVCPQMDDEVVITLEKLPTANAGPDQTICSGTSIQLSGMLNTGSGSWSGGTGTYTPSNMVLSPTYTPSAMEITAGQVNLKFTVTNGSNATCPDALDDMVITIQKTPFVNAGPDQAICSGEAVQLSGTLNPGSTGIWSGGSGTYVPTNTSPNAVYTPSKTEEQLGVVKLFFTSNDPLTLCSKAIDSMNVTIDKKIIVTAGDPIAICEGDVIKLNGNISGGANTGTWTGGLGSYTNSNTDLKAVYYPTPKEIAQGSVTFTLTSDSTGKCPVGTAQVTHTINPRPVIDFSTDRPKACLPHCTSFWDLTASGNTPIVKWRWDLGNGDTAISKTVSNICYSNPGFYNIKLTVTTNMNCSATLQKNNFIQTYAKPKAEFIAEPTSTSLYDPVIHFYDRSSPDVASWTWNMGDGKVISPTIRNPIHTYTNELSKNYLVKLIVINTNGCIDSTEQHIEIQPAYTLFVPNAFTPSRVDGINDTFSAKGVGILEYQLWIFDRWGNMIFKSNDMNVGWDGTVNNSSIISQEDVYVWKIQLKDTFGKLHDCHGIVTLVK
jgi:gliding motility-associated-like protein